MVGPHYQSHHLSPLDPLEANTSDCMCLPFQIRPHETNVAAMHLVNLFMYHNKLITKAYEGAGWAFPVKTYYDILLTRVYFQGFKILWHSHFPPNAPHHVELEQSISSNWLSTIDAMQNACRWTSRCQAPWTKDWNKAFNCHQHHLFRYSCNPAFKAQRCLQHLIKAAKSQNELDAIFEAVRGGAGVRRHQKVAEEGERKGRLQKQS